MTTTRTIELYLDDADRAAVATYLDIDPIKVEAVEWLIALKLHAPAPVAEEHAGEPPAASAPAEKGTMASAVAPKRAKRAAAKKAASPAATATAAARPVTPERLALLRAIEAHGGTFEGGASALAREAPESGPNDTARSQTARQLARSNLVTTVRDGHWITSITLTAAGLEAVRRAKGTGGAPARPAPAPEPSAASTVTGGSEPLDPAEDMRWAEEALGVG
jgi:hypothetical protein